MLFAFVILKQNIGSGNELFEDLAARLSLKVQGNALLVRVFIEENTGCFRVHLIVQIRSVLTRNIALRSFDLDDLRAKIGKHLCAMRAGDEAAVFQHLHAV